MDWTAATLLGSSPSWCSASALPPVQPAKVVFWELDSPREREIVTGRHHGSSNPRTSGARREAHDAPATMARHMQLEMTDIDLREVDGEFSDGEYTRARRLSTGACARLRPMQPRNDATTDELHRYHTGGLVRAEMAAREGSMRRRIRECLGLRRGEGSRAVHVFAASVVVNVILFVAIIAVASSPRSGSETSPPNAAPRSAAEEHVSTTLGAVAADEGRCSAIGAAVLDDGGHAVDASIAAALCLGVTHPHSSGVGGGAFMVIRLANGTHEAIEFRESAPAAAYRDMYVDGSGANGANRSSTFGGAAVAVPAELAGLHLAWERHGRLPWRRLVEPAALLANGFEVGKDLAREIADMAEDLAKFPVTKEVFLKADGSPLLEGETCANTRLAATLRRVANEGPSVLRTGELADALAKDIRDAGGVMESSDLAAYRPRIFEPIVASAMGVELIGMPPPSSGGAAVAQIIEFLDGYDLPLASAGTLGTHRTAEAFKHAFAMRMNLGDPDSATPDMTAALNDMLSPTFNAELRSMTKDDRTLNVTAYGAKWNQLDDSGTTHVSVVDKDRNAVALTSTINTEFGSKLVSPSTGIVLNNEMDDFSSPGEVNHYGLAPHEANFIAAGKRPLSSMSPTIVTRGGKLYAVAGASGGPRIITATAQLLLNVIARGMSPLDAVNAPRLHHQLVPHVAFAENQRCLGTGPERKLSEADVEALRSRGHEVEYTDSKTATTQLVVVDIDTGEVHAVSDARKGGKPAAQSR